MAADITQILAAVEAALTAAFPGVLVLVKAAPATHPGETPQPGWTLGSTLPCFCVSELDAEQVDKGGMFGLYAVGARVAVEYVKSAAPKNWMDDPDVRDKRQALIDLLYTGAPGTNLPGLPPAAFDVRCQPLPVYAATAAKDTVASGLVLTYTFTRPRS